MSCKAVELLPPLYQLKSFGSCVLKLFMEACLSIKFAYLDWLTCKKCLLGGHGKARRTVIASVKSYLKYYYSWLARDVRYFSIFGYPPCWCSTAGKISMCLYAYMPSLFSYNGFFGK